MHWDIHGIFTECNIDHEIWQAGKSLNQIVILTDIIEIQPCLIKSSGYIDDETPNIWKTMEG